MLPRILQSVAYLIEDIKMVLDVIEGAVRVACSGGVRLVPWRYTHGGQRRTERQRDENRFHGYHVSIYSFTVASGDSFHGS